MKFFAFIKWTHYENFLVSYEGTRIALEADSPEEAKHQAYDACSQINGRFPARPIGEDPWDHNATLYRLEDEEGNILL